MTTINPAIVFIAGLNTDGGTGSNPTEFGVSGSGTLISPDEVLTATHITFWSNMSDGSMGTPTTNIAVGTVTAVDQNQGTQALNTHYNTIQTTSIITPQYDFSVIHLKQPLGNTDGYFGYAQDYPGGTVTFAGYPDEGNPLAPTPDSNSADVLTSQGVTGGYNYFLGTAPLAPGSSGGPNYITSSAGVPDIVAVHSGTTPDGTSDVGAALTAAAVSEIEFWLSQDGESPGIIRLYHGVLGRAPDQSGLTTYSGDYTFVAGVLQGQSGNPLNSPSAAAVLTADLSASPSLVDDFLNSTEFQTAHPNISNSGLVDLLYQQALGRTPASNDSGANTWINDLNNGTLTREAVVIGIVESSEAIAYGGHWGVLA